MIHMNMPDSLRHLIKHDAYLFDLKSQDGGWGQGMSYVSLSLNVDNIQPPRPQGVRGARR